MRFRTCLIPWLLFLVCSFTVAGEKSESRARILKVLPHLLDTQGRHALSPSLLERDAYQALLKDNPDKVSNLRFDVNWKLKEKFDANLELRVEVRLGNGNIIQTLKAKRPLRPKKLRKRVGPPCNWKKKNMTPSQTSLPGVSPFGTAMNNSLPKKVSCGEVRSPTLV